MEISIGTPVINMYGARGFISRVVAAEAGKFTLGAGRMVAVRREVEVCFDDHLSVVPETIVGPWIRSAENARLPRIPEGEIEARRAKAKQAQADAREEARRAQGASAARAAAFQIEAAEKMPAWAKAVIVAELIADRSDTMTDYFGSTTVRTVILGFSRHTRDLFPELRRAALGFPETAHLFNAPETAEHREKYSMGGGYYLKIGSRHSDGWKVSKKKLYDGARSIPVGEWHLEPVAPSRAQAQPAASGGGVSIQKHTHTKHRFDMWIVVLPGRVDRETFDALRTVAKLRGGWYSSRFGASPAGFAFKSEADANAFAACHWPPPTHPEDDEQASAAAPRCPHGAGATVAEKLRGLADKLQSDIDARFADRLTNTPKRQRQAASARQEGARLQRTQQAMRALADLHEAGTVPVALSGVVTKSALYDLCRSKIDTSRSGYYDAGIDTNTPAVDSEAARAVWSLLSGQSEQERRASALRDKIEKLQFANIPGYFPTPAEIVDRMIAAARLPSDCCTVLEPSAGAGAILDRVRATRGGETFRYVVFERHLSLQDILRDKGYELAGGDFAQADDTLRVDRVLMNPPFENRQDVAHIKRAGGMLRPGGRLVAICANGSRQKAELGPLCSEWHDLPAGAFKASGTGVNAALIVIDARS